MNENLQNEYEWATDYDVESLNSEDIFDAVMTDLETEFGTDLSEFEQDVHAEIATEAQQMADEAIENGDYESAAEFREVAEDSAVAAGDDSMLHGANSAELEAADQHQDQALELQQQQAEHAQEGDYEAAREDSFNAAQEMQTADHLAGGSDHSGQAQAEFDQMDWAVHHEEQADYYADNAMDYAEQGDFENAEMYAEQADYHQDFADHHGDLGEHGGDIAVHDPASEIQSTDYMYE